ncbi:MAG: sulfatase-like hydrolase/transferase [Firmicutes bacterium]|nr:sulfatase-like hydrolase/transferase [Bacillota bacterium]
MNSNSIGKITIDRRMFFGTSAMVLGAMALGVTTAGASVAGKGARKPNIILILDDDLGAKELSCYGSTRHQTPNLDRMASTGMRFETFYAMPLCTPTRVALMTGQYGFHNGFLGMLNPAFRPAPGSSQDEIGKHFTFADLLKSRGYATALSGKWQLSGKLPTLIHDAGFDEYRMWAYAGNLPNGIQPPAYEKNGKTPSRYWHPCIVENGKYLPTKPDDFGPDLFNDFVIDFAHRHKDKPFFIYYTSVLTHEPRVETPDPAKPGARWPAGLKSNLEYMDYLMGKLFASLKADGLDENTLVIFLGDNGTGGEGKGRVTELGARVPCIVRGPGVKRGIVSRAIGDITDIMPTLAEFSGAKLPKDQPFDGHSLGPVLRGEKEKHRDWIYSHLDDGRVLRDQRWLLEISPNGKGEKFFDCGQSRDGTGYKDVTGSTDPEVKAARERFAAILASMPEPKPRYSIPQEKKKKRKAILSR